MRIKLKVLDKRYQSFGAYDMLGKLWEWCSDLEAEKFMVGVIGTVLSLLGSFAMWDKAIPLFHYQVPYLAGNYS